MPHTLDEALTPVSKSMDGDVLRWTGRGHKGYWNMVGPYGGITAATITRAILDHPAVLGEPIALTVNFAAGLAEGEFTVNCKPARTNRSTQHWQVDITQRSEKSGEHEVVITATAITAARRETWSTTDAVMPSVGKPAQFQRSNYMKVLEWPSRYDIRPVTGDIPTEWNGAEHESLSQVWMRDDPLRPIDFPALTAMSDIFYPRIWLRRAKQTPVGTISITIYFHANSAQLALTGTSYLLGQARGQEFRNGFHDHTAQLWDEAGALLVTTHQIVYYKE